LFTYIFYAKSIAHVAKHILTSLKPCPHCRRKVRRLSHKSETVAATVALFFDSVDRL